MSMRALGTRIGWVALLLGACFFTAACSRKSAVILVEVPAEFSGQVRIEMGIPGAPALEREGRNYRVMVPPDGKVVTSTMIEDAGAQFVNVDARRVWGYSRSMVRTGDRLTVGGNIDFFIGTKEQFESAEAKKHKSGLQERVRTLG